MTDPVAASAAFDAHAESLREQSGPETLIVRPKVFRLPHGGIEVIGGWGFLDGAPALVPAHLTVLVVTEGDVVNDHGCRFSDALAVLSPYSSRRVTPVDHYAITVPEDEKAALMAKLKALPAVGARGAPVAAGTVAAGTVAAGTGAAGTGAAGTGAAGSVAAAAPSAQDERAINADIDAAEPVAAVKIAAAVQSLSGLMVGLTGLQLVGSRWVDGWMSYGSYALIALGVASIAMAANQYRARGWAGPGSLALTAVTMVTVLGWLALTFTSVMSCMAYMAVPLSMLATVLSIVALPRILDTARARRRLSDQGISLGL